MNEETSAELINNRYGYPLISPVHSPILCFINDVTYFHVEGPVFILQGAICGSLWKIFNEEYYEDVNSTDLIL